MLEFRIVASWSQQKLSNKLTDRRVGPNGLSSDLRLWSAVGLIACLR